MHLLLFVMSFIALGQSPTVSRNQDCLRYEPTVVKLTGAIKQVTFPGPPNYESVSRGDKPEAVWVLYLVQPVCVRPGYQDELNEPETKVTRLQLVFDDTKAYQQYVSLLGKGAIVEGTLFHAQTGHHHTKVLLTVQHISKRP